MSDTEEKKETIERKVSFQSLSSLDDTIECPICLDNFIEYFLADCKHAWCNQCNLNIEGNLCPICRQPFKKLCKPVKIYDQDDFNPVIITRRRRYTVRNRNRNLISNCFCNIQ